MGGLTTKNNTKNDTFIIGSAGAQGERPAFGLVSEAGAGHSLEGRARKPSFGGLRAVPRVAKGAQVPRPEQGPE